MGANPIALGGAILSAGVFGDNFAPISDSTIVACSTLGVDIPTAVKRRLPYSSVAGIISFVLFLIVGGGGEVNSSALASYDLLTSGISPLGLIMIIPAVLTIVLAFKGLSLIQAMTFGIFCSLILGGVSGLITVDTIFSIKDGVVGGAIVDGIGGFAEIVLLIMMIGALSYIMQASGAVESILEKIKAKAIRTPKQADILNFFVILTVAIPLCNGIVAEIIAGPLMKDICDEYDLSRYKAANYADAVNCGLSGLLPWGGSTLVFCSLTKVVNETYGFATIFSDPVKLMPYIIYPVLIIGIYLLTAVTGIGTKHEQKKWQDAKKSGIVS